ncbi:MAG: hypothetical protein HY689_15075, partial [Chloroflexi bacterium]|nr:hypothetical protein [Chloroflexota bacterium]
AAIFHLYNHAFFKALLFLGSGSVNHATGTFNMQYMGGLRRAMPWTFWTLMVASLSLAGIFPFSGFWSKDEILAESLGNPLLFGLALAAAFMTAFYVFRMMFLTFFGSYRGGLAAEIAETGAVPVPAYATGDPHTTGGEHAADGHEEEHGQAHGTTEHRLHESPWIMVGPLVVLAVPSVVSWVVNPPWSLALGIPQHWLSDFLFNQTYRALLPEHHAAAFNPAVAVLSVVVALAGIGLAYLMYMKGAPSPKAAGALLGGVPYRVLSNKWGFDHLYEEILIRRVLYRLVAAFLDAFDARVVDGVVNGAGDLARSLGNGVRRLQSGQVQSYGLAIFMGVVVIMAVYLTTG